MDFSVTIDNETRIFEQYYDALAYIGEKTAYWNNFEPDTEFHVKITKVPSPIPTLGVSTAETMKVSAMFGGQP